MINKKESNMVTFMDIEFRHPTLDDREWISAKYAQEGCRGCDGSFVNLYLWGRGYGKIARVGDFLVQFIEINGKKFYAYPAGKGDFRWLIRMLAEDAKAYGHQLRILCVTNCRKNNLEEAFPGKFTYEPVRSSFDYLYEVTRLADLPGKKLQSKRNHINRFEAEHSEWHTERITPENLPEVRAMAEMWYAQYDGETSDEHDFRVERVALGRAFDEYEELGFEGILLRAEGNILAFTMGNRITPDTFDVNFEKAFGEVQGAYPLINREFARYVRETHPEIVYLNREDDMGLPGLRKAKESYHPDILLEKSMATLAGEL